jgi:hypothetical protein
MKKEVEVAIDLAKKVTSVARRKMGTYQGATYSQLADDWEYAVDVAPNEPAKHIAGLVNNIIQNLDKRGALGDLSILDDFRGIEYTGRGGAVATPTYGPVSYRMELTGLKNGKAVPRNWHEVFYNFA